MKLPPGHVEGKGVVRPTGYGGLGERLMRGMGWQAGQGLGKEKDGIKEAIQVKKKEDTLGVRRGVGPLPASSPPAPAATCVWTRSPSRLRSPPPAALHRAQVGGNATYKWEDKWWERAFDSAARTLGSGGDAVQQSSSSDESERSGGAPRSSGFESDTSSGGDSSSSSDSDSDAEQAGRARKGRAVNRDGTTASGSAVELALMEELSRSKGRVAAGRFGGRDAKMERIRAQEARQAAEAAAKLGLAAPPPPAAAPAAVPASDDSETTSEAQVAASGGSGSGSKKGKRKRSEDSGKAGKARKKRPGAGKTAAAPDGDAGTLEQPPPPKRIVIEPKGLTAAPAFAFEPTPAAGALGGRARAG